MLPQSLITVSIVTPLFPRLSHAAAQGRKDVVTSQLNTGIRVNHLTGMKSLPERANRDADVVKSPDNGIFAFAQRTLLS